MIRCFHDAETLACSYLLVDPRSCEAGVVDPVLEQVDAYAAVIEQMGLTLRFAVDTHLHADHKSGAFELRRRYHNKVVTPAGLGAAGVDQEVGDGDTLSLGSERMRVLSTPGQTPFAISLHLPGPKAVVFTGDVLHRGEVPLPECWPLGAQRQFGSVRTRLFLLGDDTRVYPGHDRQPATPSTIRDERLHNPWLRQSITLAEFEQRLRDEGRRAHYTLEGAAAFNLRAGAHDDLRSVSPRSRALQRLHAISGPPPASIEWLAEWAPGAAVLDFRPKAEFRASHLNGAVHVTACTVAEVTRTWDRARPLALIGADVDTFAAVQALQFLRVFAVSEDLSGWRRAGLEELTPLSNPPLMVAPRALSVA